MPAPTPLPDDLTSGPIRPRDLTERGIGYGVTRGQRLHRVTHGAYLLTRDPTLLDRCRALQAVVPGEVTFSHHTAAELLGMPGWAGTGAAVHLTRPPGAAQLRRQRVIQHRSALALRERIWVDGLPVTSPTRTLLDLGSSLRLDQLVATGDFSLRHLAMSRTGLLAAIDGASSRRGVLVLRKAVVLMDGRAQSPQESLVRVWCAVAGLPHLEPQGEVYDGETLVATVDLLDSAHRLAVEYEGAHHRQREQFAYDVGRYRRVRRCGYEVVQIEASMMYSSRTVVLTVADEMLRRGWAGRPHPERLARLWRPHSR